MHQPLSYRLDIQGLRAIAILLVVLSHAGWLYPGYIGVDIFFVISGYLITGQLRDELAFKNGINFINFYARRIRRLLPALFVMLAVVAFFIWFLFSPLEQSGLWRTVLASVFYISNFRFSGDAMNYWGADAKSDPLLHTWSLAVEEQFYLVWPFLILIFSYAWRRNFKLAVLLTVLSLFLVSFGLSILWSQYRQPDAFFMLYARAWEFGCGALLAYSGAHIDRFRDWLKSPLLLFLALSFLLAALFGIQKDSVYPGWWVVLPVLSASCFIAAKSDKNSILTRFWRLRPLQAMGEWSYGWYLWHWPLLVFAHMLWPDNMVVTIIVVFVSLILAALSYRYIESPVRSRPIFRKNIFTVFLLVLVPFTFFISIHFVEAKTESNIRNPEMESIYRAASDAPGIYAAGCDAWYHDDDLILCEALIKKSKQTWMLIGDSHAGQWASTFGVIAQKHGISLVIATKSACPMAELPFFYERIGRIYRECDSWRGKLFQKIAMEKPDVVIMSSAESYPFESEAWASGLSSTYNQLTPHVGALIVIRDTPSAAINPVECLARREWNPAAYKNPCEFNLNLNDSLHRLHQDFSRSYPNMTYLDMTDHICPDGKICPLVSNGFFVFRNSNHLANKFALSLAPVFEARLEHAGVLGQ